MTAPESAPVANGHGSGESSPIVRLLCVGGDQDLWSTARTLAPASVRWQWTTSAACAVQCPQAEHYDCIVLAPVRRDLAAESAWHSAELMTALRTGGYDGALFVLAPAASADFWRTVYETESEAIVVAGENWPELVWPGIERSVSRRKAVAQQQRLTLADQLKRNREREQAESILSQQRELLHQLSWAGEDLVGEPPASNDSSPSGSRGQETVEFPVEVRQYYQQLLRQQVIMGSGQLPAEVAQLVETFCSAEIPPRQALELHLSQLEELLRGLGSRSTRHALDRAALLGIELMVQLAEGYYARSKSARPWWRSDQPLSDTGVDLSADAA